MFNGFISCLYSSTFILQFIMCSTSLYIIVDMVIGRLLSKVWYGESSLLINIYLTMFYLNMSPSLFYIQSLRYLAIFPDIRHVTSSIHDFFDYLISYFRQFSPFILISNDFSLFNGLNDTLSTPITLSLFILNITFQTSS